MMRAAAVLLSIWSGLNLAVAAVVVAAMIFAGRHAPALTLYASDAARTLDPRVVAAVDALAILGNGCIAALCALVLVVVWRGLVRGARWTLPALAATLGPLQAIGFASDARLGHRNLAVNILSTGILVSGLALAARVPRTSVAENK